MTNVLATPSSPAVVCPGCGIANRYADSDLYHLSVICSACGKTFNLFRADQQKPAPKNRKRTMTDREQMPPPPAKKPKNKAADAIIDLTSDEESKNIFTPMVAHITRLQERISLLDSHLLKAHQVVKDVIKKYGVCRRQAHLFKAQNEQLRGKMKEMFKNKMLLEIKNKELQAKLATAEAQIALIELSAQKE